MQTGNHELRMRDWVVVLLLVWSVVTCCAVAASALARLLTDVTCVWCSSSVQPPVPTPTSAHYTRHTQHNYEEQGDRGDRTMPSGGKGILVAK